MPEATLIRNITVDLNVGTEAVPDWLPVEGINNTTHAPATGRADVRTYDDNGRHRHLVASRGDSFTFAGLKKLDESNGDRPPGQEAVEAWGRDMGQDARRQVRINDQSGAIMAQFFASAEVTLLGGGNDDPNAWSFSVEVDGDIT